jgi:predicted Zn-dependent protease
MRRTARSIALVLVAGPLLAQEPDPAERSRRGSELMAAGRYAEAVPIYRDLVKSVPGNAGLLLNLGMALHLSGHDDEAVGPLADALKLTPDSVPAALFLGVSRMRLGQTAAAVAPLQSAVRLQPENRQARSMLTDALVALGRHAEAEPHLRRLSRADPKNPLLWFALGKTYEALAGQAFGRLLDRDPESPLTLALVAEARLDEGQTTAAFLLYRRALERAPSQRGLHAGVAEVYRRTAHPDWAAVEEEKENQLPKADCARDPLECAFAAGKHRDVLVAASKLETPLASYWLARAANALAVEAFARLTALPPSAPSH